MLRFPLSMSISIGNGKHRWTLSPGVAIRRMAKRGTNKSFVYTVPSKKSIRSITLKVRELTGRKHLHLGPAFAVEMLLRRANWEAGSQSLGRRIPLRCWNAPRPEQLPQAVVRSPRRARFRLGNPAHLPQDGRNPAGGLQGDGCRVSPARSFQRECDKQALRAADARRAGQYGRVAVLRRHLIPKRWVSGGWPPENEKPKEPLIRVSAGQGLFSCRATRT